MNIFRFVTLSLFVFLQTKTLIILVLFSALGDAKTVERQGNSSKRDVSQDMDS